MSEDEYARKTKRTEYLLARHREIVAAGFKPESVAVNDPGIHDKPLIHESCDVCDYTDLLGIIKWVHPTTGEICHTGFTCFGRVTEKLVEVSEKDRRTLRWISQNRSRFYNHKYSISQAESIRIASYVNPVYRVYQSDWERAVSDVYSRRDKFNLTALELGVLETLHCKSGRYWRGHPTPRQRAVLNDIIFACLKAGLEPSERVR